MGFLNGADLILSVRILDRGCTLNYRSNTGFISSSLCLVIADLGVAPEEANRLVGFVGNGVDMGAPFHIIVDVYNKILFGDDVFNGMSMQFM